MRLRLFFAITTLTLGLGASQTKASDKAINHQGLNFKHKTSKTVSEVLNDSEKLRNNLIQVSGTIKKVCPMAGCWVDIQDPSHPNDPNKMLHVKVNDGDIVFPKNSIGKRLTVEGMLNEKKLTKSQAIKHFKHRAEELGIPFDKKSITGPMILWELKGVAAKVE